jgi:hypothetical protein
MRYQNENREGERGLKSRRRRMVQTTMPLQCRWTVASYCRNELAPGKLTTRDALLTAVIIDKYDISTNPLKYAILEWLGPSCKGGRRL